MGALVVGADALSRWVDWDDRNTSILFGDGAGAMVLGASEGSADAETCGLLGFSMHSDGEGHDLLQLAFNGALRELHTSQGTMILSKGGYSCITMEGGQVFSFAVSRVPQVIREALHNAGLSMDQVDWLVLHQANMRILEAVAEDLG